MTKTLGSFKSTLLQGGSVTDYDMICMHDMLGKKRDWEDDVVRLLAHKGPDGPADKQDMAVSPKTQTVLLPNLPGTICALSLKQIKATSIMMHPQFQSNVVRPMNITNILAQEVKTSSSTGLQNMATVLALGKSNVNVYPIDEPSPRMFLRHLLQVCARTKQILGPWTRSSI